MTSFRRLTLPLLLIASLAGCWDSAANVVVLAPPDLAAGSQNQTIDWKPFSLVLTRHVSRNDGRVDYFAIAHDEWLNQLTQTYGQIARVGPRSRTDLFPSRADKLCYYINAHNLLAVLAIAPHFGPGRVDPLKVSDLEAPLMTGHVFVLDGRDVTLETIRRELVTPLLDGDPRPLLALCAGRRNDPPLRNELYVPTRLDAQLDEQLVRVLRESPWAEINYERRQLELPAAVAEHREYYWSRYLAIPGRSRDRANFVTVLLNLADDRGRRWLNRAISYKIVAAEPTDKFNNKPLFPSSPD